MKRLDTALAGVVLLASVICVLQITSWIRAEAVLLESRASLSVMQGVAAEIKSLRKHPPLIGERPMPSERFVGMASEVAAQAALSPNAIKSVEAEQESAATTNIVGTGASFRRQSVRVALDAISLPELGSFLGSWRGLHPSWTSTRIDLSPMPLPSTNGRGATSVQKWNVRLAFTNVYLPE